MNKSKTLTFFLSALPGLGHYYLGQMNRGLQMMALFFGSMFLLSFLRLDFAYVIIIIWFYSLFDVLQQHRKINEQKELIDPPLLSWEKLLPKKHWIGWFLIIIGLYSLLNRISLELGWEYYSLLRSITLSLILIIVGIYLISGKRLFSKVNERKGH